MAYKKPNLVRIVNQSGGTIPYWSFVRITEWNDSSKAFYVSKPNADNMLFSDILVVPMPILNNDIGLAYSDGICMMVKTAGETIAAGDKVGTDNGQFTAIKIANDALGNNDGQFLVLHAFGDGSLMIRPRVRNSLIQFIS